MNSYHHAQTSAKRWGGTPEDYLPIHEFIDSSKRTLGDPRHRSLYHHTEGVWLCQRIFGAVVTVDRLSRDVVVPVRLIAEQHILEDVGWLPTPADWLRGLVVEPWMSGAQRKTLPLSHLKLKDNNDGKD